MAQIQQRTDGELLSEFAQSGNQESFAELMRRHGAMVQGISLRILGDHHEAEDVTQAVFLVLARKAAKLRKDPSISGWLHRVAVCMARDAWSSRASRRQREDKVMQDAPANEPAAVDREAFRAEVDAAIDQLPDRYRRPLTVFHLEGRSLLETAQVLGLNASTAGNRLARAREMLRKKLLRRGVKVGSVGALVALLSEEAGAASLSASLIASTVKAAASGGAGMVSAHVAALTKGALKMLFWSNVKTVGLTTAACLVVGGTGIYAANQLSPAGPAVSAPGVPGGRPVAAPVRGSVGAPAVPGQPAVVAGGTMTVTGKEVLEKGLGVTVQAAKPEFTTKKRLEFNVTFANRGQEEIVLMVSDFLGSQAAGKFTPSIRNVATGEKWRFEIFPSRAPMRMYQETIKPGGTLDLHYTLPGMFVKADGTKSPSLPAGKYELDLTIEINGLVLTPKPAAFTVVEAPVRAAAAMEKYIVQARVALGEKLAQQAKAEEQAGKGSLPAGILYSSLKPEMFAVETDEHENGVTVKFAYELPNTGRVLQWSVPVTDAGVSSNFRMFGFTVAMKQKTPVSVRPVEPQ